MAKGQVWIETVVYTLIGLGLIGLVLAFATPKINEYRDRAVVDQTIQSLNVIDSKINEVLQAPLNTRVVEYTLKRGTLTFNAINESISYMLEDSHVIYSEPGELTGIGRIGILTGEGKKTRTINLTLSYNFNLDYENNLTNRVYTAAATPYRFSFEHRGFTPDGKPIIFFRELSGA